MKEDLLSRFSSRKFLTAVGLFAAAVLQAAGVLDTEQEAQVATWIGAAAYIVVEGLIDLLRR